MKAPSILALLALTLPLSAEAGGNILNGPKNCESLGGEASDDTGHHSARLTSLCTRLNEGNLSESEQRELRDAGVNLEDKYGR